MDRCSKAGCSVVVSATFSCSVEVLADSLSSLISGTWMSSDASSEPVLGCRAATLEDNSRVAGDDVGARGGVDSEVGSSEVPVDLSGVTDVIWA